MMAKSRLKFILLASLGEKKRNKMRIFRNFSLKDETGKKLSATNVALLTTSVFGKKIESFVNTGVRCGNQQMNRNEISFFLPFL